MLLFKTIRFSKTFFVIDVKGQLISKCLLGVFNTPEKLKKKFDFTTMVPQVDLFSFVFWRKSKTPKTISKLSGL